MGDINQGNTTFDYEDEEKRRLMSVNLAISSFTWNKFSCCLVDVPGYMDFVGEQISASVAVDCAVLNIAADNGVEVGTEKAYTQLLDRKIPFAIFLNKCDTDHDFEKIWGNVCEWLGNKPVLFTFPEKKDGKIEKILNLFDADPSDPLVGKYVSHLLDSIAEVDDSLMEKYLEGEPLTREEKVVAFKKGIVEGAIVPVLCGSGISSLGVSELLDCMVEYFPSAIEMSPMGAKDSKGEDIEVVREETGPCSGIVFKTHFDPFMGRISYLKVLTGKLTANFSCMNASQGTKERIGQLFRFKGKKQEPATEAGPGEIVGVAKLSGFNTFETFCDPSQVLLYSLPSVPEAALSFSLSPKVKGTEDKLGNAIAKISEEDCTVKVFRDNDTGETIIAGMGDVHLDVTLNKFKEKFGVEVVKGIPRIAYKETITKRADADTKFKRQTGGHGQYGHAVIIIEPLPRGSGFEFSDEVVGGAIPRQYIPSVEKGVKDAMSKGVLAGYPVVDIRVRLTDGSYHPVDSSDIAFQVAGAMALQKAVSAGNPVLLEPIMNVEVTVPQEFTGDIIGTVNAKRGRVLDMVAHGASQIVKAQIPLSEISNYATELRSLTSGRGAYSLQLAHYEEVPNHLAEKVLSARKAEKEAEKS